MFFIIVSCNLSMIISISEMYIYCSLALIILCTINNMCVRDVSVINCTSVDTR